MDDLKKVKSHLLRELVHAGYENGVTLLEKDKGEMAIYDANNIFN